MFQGLADHQGTDQRADNIRSLNLRTQLEERWSRPQWSDFRSIFLTDYNASTVRTALFDEMYITKWIVTLNNDKLLTNRAHVLLPSASKWRVGRQRFFIWRRSTMLMLLRHGKNVYSSQERRGTDPNQ
jgi:hypothetical protein